MSVEIRGADQLTDLSRRLKAAGDKALQRQLARAIKDAVAPLKDALAESAMDSLPSRGGLNARVAASKVKVSRRDSGSGSGLKLIAKNAYALAKLDEGAIRHPTFGRRGRRYWVTQQVEPGWFTRPVEEAAPEIQEQIQAAMAQVAAQIAGRPGAGIGS